MSDAQTQAPEDILQMSDEEMMNLTDDAALTPEEASEGATDPSEGGQEAQEEAVEGEDTQQQEEEPAESNPEETPEASQADAFSGSEEPEQKADEKPQEAEKSEAKEEPTKAEDADEGPDYKAAYEEIMAPFKAVGREMRAKSPQEVRRLMQMGVDYGQKMKAMQPSLKVLKMLEKNNLLDESKISYLIDLDQKEPKAIQKLVQESKIDPLDFDANGDTDYTPTNHAISDSEMAFSAALEEVTSTQAGQEVVVHIDRSWDAQSKKMIAEEPGLLGVMRDHKEKGFYDKITAEVDRQRILGQIPASTPYVTAYQHVGQELDRQGLLAAPQTTDTAPTGQVIETRTAKPQQRTASGSTDRAKAAATTRSTPRNRVQKAYNPLSMSDEEFEKNAGIS